MKDPERYVGIDVSNDSEGLAALLEYLVPLHPTLVVLEATGGVEVAVTATLAEAGVPIVVVNPRQVRDFAKATGKLAKTDRIDAQVLARFAQGVRPQPRPIPEATTRELKALVSRRRQLLEMVTMEQNRLRTSLPRIRPQLEEHIGWLRSQVEDVDHQITTLLHSSPLWRIKENLLRSTPGVGPVLSSTSKSLRLAGPAA